MKFAEHLSAHITPEWRKQYINYEEMKAMLYTANEEAPALDSVEEDVRKRHFANFDENFYHYCDQELKKINTFYSEKLAEATRKYAALITQLRTTLESQQKSKSKGHSHKPINLPYRKAQELKLAFSEFYLSLILLQNYQNLNHTGFRKILKKHDKILASDNGARYQKEHVEMSHFFINKDIDKLINDTESTVTSQLEGGDRQRAMKRLRVPPLGEQQSPWTTFKVGLFSGSFVVLFVAVILSAVFHDSATGENLKIAFRLYRGPLLLIEFVFLIGVNIYGWRSSGVNHVLIFELDPRNHLSEQHLMEMAAIFGVVWTLSLLSFLYSASLSIPPYVNPLLLTVIMIAFLINPLRVFRYEARFWLLRTIGRMVAAPFFHVGFADFWLADQLNSLVTALLDFQFLTCFYVTNGNWLEAGKTKYEDASENVFLWLWLLSSAVSSCYAYTWDIKMDWGLFDKNAGENTFLREEIVYSMPFFYYFAIIEDLVLRFVWIVSYALTENGLVSGDLMTSILAPLEVFRRFVWNFFRLENEHLNNCGKFRAVRDISIAPIDSNDQVIILKMMDDEDGVVNR
ncbi:solute carrier family 53 member 1 isoform X2 [Anopheles ziemanni]|uniref:solute carrier family 53 member 1 isoform X2 n=1 Tax=Anopheles ziemanni TaxID=345580 RepID=UPI00265E146F|nr:solute carrier family 53 member 1 isoform X2 [Anopheles ziemanni]